MQTISAFDIIGPIMTGPSSSHTAGAAKIGLELKKIMKGKLQKAKIILYNSFADTGEGHGTKTAIIGGLLGIDTDQEKLKESIKIAKTQKVKIKFVKKYDYKKHPNSTTIICTTTEGKYACHGKSIGGGLILFKKLKIKKTTKVKQ